MCSFVITCEVNHVSNDIRLSGKGFGASLLLLVSLLFNGFWKAKAKAQACYLQILFLIKPAMPILIPC